MGDEAEAVPEEAPPAVDEGDDANETIFPNLYQTKILPPWDEPAKAKGKDDTDLDASKPQKTSSPKDYTVALTDGNASQWGNITRVGWKGRVDYAVNRYIEERSRAILSRGDPFRDPNVLLQATISTIILLASDEPEVPKENFLYAELYLKNIKDENGDHPPNISDFLKHLRYLKKQRNIELEEGYKMMPPENLTITKICKKSKIPVKINRSGPAPPPPPPPVEEPPEQDPAAEE